MNGRQYLDQIQHKGTDIHVFDGFTVYHGAHNIFLGSHIHLADALINAGSTFGTIIIEDYAFFGHRVMVLARAHDYAAFNLDRQKMIYEKPIHIKQGAWIASGAIILGGVTIGEHAVVAAGSVVINDVAPYTIVGGNPAKYIKTIQISESSVEDHRLNSEFQQTNVSRSNLAEINVSAQYWGAYIVPERLSTVIRHATQGSRILDIGTGRGAYVKKLQEQGYYVTGIDQTLYPEWHGEMSQAVLNASALRLPFADKSFDLSISFEVLEHIPQPEVALREIARCTRDKFILSVPNCSLDNPMRQYNLVAAHWSDPTHCNFFTKESIAGLLHAEGFDIVEMSDCVRISPHDYYWDSIKINRRIASLLKKIGNRFNLAESYWSSILIVASVTS